MVNIWTKFVQISGSACPLCHAPAVGLCGACLATLPRNLNPCPCCALPLPAAAPPGRLCAACQSRPPAFDQAFAPLLYAPPVDDLVARLKYHGQLALGPALASIVAEALRGRPDLPALLLPVPADAVRLRERGFNQAGELARVLAGRLGVPWNGGRLRRVRAADPQRGLTRRQRRRNLRGAFACDGGLPAHVALVDDVMTTGATAEEAGGTLKRAGVQRVEVWAVARTPTLHER